MALPHVSTSILLFPLDATENSRHFAVAFWRESWVEAILVAPIRNVNSLVLRYWVRINSPSRCNAMFPLFLHLRMHHQQRVMRQVD